MKTCSWQDKGSLPRLGGGLCPPEGVGGEDGENGGNASDDIGLLLLEDWRQLCRVSLSTHLRAGGDLEHCQGVELLPGAWPEVVQGPRVTRGGCRGLV